MKTWTWHRRVLAIATVCFVTASFLWLWQRQPTELASVAHPSHDSASPPPPPASTPDTSAFSTTALTSEPAPVAATVTTTTTTHADSLALLNTATNAQADWMLRLKAVRDIGKTAGENAVPALAGLLTSTNEENNIRYNAAVALGRIATEASVQALGLALHDPNSTLRFKVVQALEQTQRPSAAPFVKMALDDPDPYTAVRAINALGTLGLKDQIPRLLHVLDAPGTSDFKRIACLNALSVLGDGSLIEVLRPYQNDQSRLVRIHAERAMQRVKERQTL